MQCKWCGVKRGVPTVGIHECHPERVRERAMRDIIADLCAWFRMPDEEFDRTHADETRVAHATADAIERHYGGTRVARLAQRDSGAHPIPGSRKLDGHSLPFRDLPTEQWIHTQKETFRAYPWVVVVGDSVRAEFKTQAEADQLADAL